MFNSYVKLPDGNMRQWELNDELIQFHGIDQTDPWEFCQRTLRDHNGGLLESKRSHAMSDPQRRERVGDELLWPAVSSE